MSESASAESPSTVKARRIEALNKQTDEQKAAALESLAMLQQEIEDDLYQEASSRARGLANMLSGMNATLNTIADLDS